MGLRGALRGPSLTNKQLTNNWWTTHPRSFFHTLVRITVHFLFVDWWRLVLRLSWRGVELTGFLTALTTWCCYESNHLRASLKLNPRRHTWTLVQLRVCVISWFVCVTDTTTWYLHFSRSAIISICTRLRSCNVMCWKDEMNQSRISNRQADRHAGGKLQKRNPPYAYPRYAVEICSPMCDCLPHFHKFAVMFLLELGPCLTFAISWKLEFLMPHFLWEHVRKVLHKVLECVWL